MPADDAPTLRVIARIRSPFSAKFGVPRQSGLVPELSADVVFEPEFRDADALRGIEGFSHVWLLWGFSLSRRERWSPTVRPPRLGGRRRLGVFATRSPFRPNPIGLSSVALLDVVAQGPDAPLLRVGGADLVDGTPIYDVKPYIATDVHPGARFGFVAEHPEPELEIHDPDGCLGRVPAPLRTALAGVLARDPRPRFLDDPQRIYGLPFAGWDVRFRLADGAVTVLDITPLGEPSSRADVAAQDRRESWPDYGRQER